MLQFLADTDFRRGLVDRIGGDDAALAAKAAINPEHTVRVGACGLSGVLELVKRSIAGACEDKQMSWESYIPVYRTPAGTGCGLAFASWT